jgi:hypothetical protein
MLTEKLNVIITENKLRAVPICSSGTSEQNNYHNFHFLYSTEIFQQQQIIVRAAELRGLLLHKIW